MIVTVTANTSIDHIVFIDSWQANKTIRARETLQSIAGKPTDAAWVLGELGISSLALGFKAGLNGAVVEQVLHAKGVETDFIPVGGESRRNLIIVCEDGSGQTTITASTLEVTDEHVAQLEERYQTALESATCVLLGGTLPHDMSPEFYTRFIRLARERDIPVIFDASEPFLSPGLAGSPSYVKPNQDELSQITGKPVNSIDEAYQAGLALKERYNTCPIITLGDAGGLAVLEDRAYRIPPLEVEIVSTAGAGDAVLAGLAASIYQGQPIEEGLRIGFAAATSTVTMRGTAECVKADIERYQEQIQLLPFPHNQ